MQPSDMMDPLGILIDGNAFLYRTYHVLRHRAKGDLTEGFIVYSFLSQLRNVQSKLGTFKPVMHIIWDGVDSRISRQKVFHDYKLNRPTPDPLIMSTRKSLIYELSYICPRLSIIYDGVEADDLLYLMATREELHDSIKRWVVCTRDEDLTQVIKEDNSAVFYNPYNKKIMNHDLFLEKYGFKPQFIVLYKALVGDTADNWPGVAGVGEKTAKKWLDNIDNIGDAIGNVLDHLKTEEKKDRFGQGLRLCELPLPGANISSWIGYLSVISKTNSENDWSRLHDKFEIKATDKAQFLVGKV